MRIAFKMFVDPGFAEEYEKRHNPIWEELESTLKQHGVQSYSIFLDEDTNTLFAYAEIKSMEEWARIGDTPVCQKWWKYMAPFMHTHEDNSPKSIPLREVFHIEQ